MKEILYIYIGDRNTEAIYKGKKCKAILQANGKTIRGRNSNILVEFEGTKVVVLARLLRKIRQEQEL